MKTTKSIIAVFILLSVLLISCENENPIIPSPKTEEVRVITFNLGLGANRCSGQFVAPFCTGSCDLNCTTQDTICVKPLLKVEESFDDIAKFLSNQFDENELGIICLQEVNTDIDGVNIINAILNEFDEKWHYTFFSPLNTTYGIATLSNIEIKEEQLWNLPSIGGNEKRGAVALKLELESKFAWVVNTHLGTDPVEQINQIEEIQNRSLALDSIVPVLICGDLNIIDIDDKGNNPITSEDIVHYKKTIQKLIDEGIRKIPFAAAEQNKFSFPSWTSPTFQRTIDYFFWLEKENGMLPEIQTLRPGPYSTTETNSVCPDYKKDNRFLSDHNGMMISHSIFE